MKSSSVASGSGTAVMTYCATTASKNESAKPRFLASITAKRLDVGKTERAHALLRLAQHRLGDIDAAQFRGGRIIRQRQSGADADIEHPAADPVGFGDGRLAALVEHLAEHQIVDRRPAPISLCDPRAVDVSQPFPALNFLIRASPRPAAPSALVLGGRTSRRRS